MSKKEATYPDKVPKYKTKAFKFDAPYIENLSNAYKTTRDISKELNTEVTAYITAARKRVTELVAIIQVLRREIREAKEALNVSNKDNLHTTLVFMETEGDPSTWLKGEEDKEAPPAK